MKTLIKLVIAAVLINAAYRAGSVFLKYYQFKDETQQMILFGQSQTVTELTRQILGEAGEREIPLDEEGVTVTREGMRTLAEVAYTESVEIFPRYMYPMNFSFNAEAYGVPGASPIRSPK